jgi:hypothetical protein
MLKLTDAELYAVMRAAAALPRDDRAKLLQVVADDKNAIKLVDMLIADLPACTTDET